MFVSSFCKWPSIKSTNGGTEFFELFDFGLALFAALLVDVLADIIDFGEEFHQAAIHGK
jgi:hypothetical protein